MIEDNELNLKIAEDTKEQLWITTRDSTKERIKHLRNSLIIEEALLELAEKKLGEIASEKDSEINKE